MPYMGNSNGKLRFNILSKKCDWNLTSEYSIYAGKLLEIIAKKVGKPILIIQKIGLEE